MLGTTKLCDKNTVLWGNDLDKDLCVKLGKNIIIFGKIQIVDFVKLCN